MKYIKQLITVLAVSFAGEVLSHLIPFPVPAGVYGIIIMLVLLTAKIVPLSAVEDTGLFLIEIMPLMFIPASVGLLASWDVIKSSVVYFLIISLVSTVLVMGVSGIVTQLIMKRKAGKNERDI